MRRSIRRNMFNLMILSLILLLLSTVLFFSIEYISNYFVRFSLSDLEIPNSSAKVLIFAPHCDDEVLGAGDLIKKTLANKGQVKVVLITNGDGFKTALEFDYLNINPSPADYIKFGYNRQIESIQALKSLGLSAKDITFLGYPDGGISSLWDSHWDNNNPFRSSFTNTFRSPYYNSMTRNAPYTGESLSKDIKKIITDFQPTHIVYPHPNDHHPDHWATNAFVKTVLAQLNYKPQKEWLYLVHRGDWPTPLRRDTQMYMTPPAKLIGMGTDWFTSDMSDVDIAKKTEAIHVYKTQLRALGLLMTAFERKSELFGVYQDFNIIMQNNEDAAIIPNDINKVISDPINDTLGLEISKDADLVGVNAEISQNENLHIFIQTNAAIDKRTRYFVNLVFIDNGNIKQLNLHFLGNKISGNQVSSGSISDYSGITTTSNGKYLHIVIPSRTIGTYDHMFLNAQSAVEDHMLDRTAWHMGIKKPFTY